MADPTRREREDAGPSFATLAKEAITAADVPADADAVTSGPPQPNDPAPQETDTDRSVRPAEGAVEVTGAHEPTPPGTGAGAVTGPSDPTSASDSFEVGPVIPGYEIEDELGRGGMGVVYKARNLRLNRPVALKMILAGAHAGREAAFRFVTEAETVARLQHPNIVQIFHIDQHGGHPYFEMEFVGGGSLADRLDGAPRPPRDAARLVETLARAMAEAHRQGIVHRDLKPGNILLTPEGVPKVADFGLAKLLTAESGLTRTDSVLGSPSYMAPEQAEGKTRAVGPAADLYALGAILYEMLTGRPPFRGATPLDTLQQAKAVDPVPPSRLVPGLPRDVETIALKCLAKDPSKRYESAMALADELRRFQAGEPIVARPVGSLERTWRWCRRNPVVAGSLGAVAAALLAVAGLALEYARTQVRALDYARTQARDTATIHELAGKTASASLKAREQTDLARRQDQAVQKVLEVERLINEEKFPEAFALLEKEVAPYLSRDPRIDELRSECSWVPNVVTDPPGADLFRRPRDKPDAVWERLGQTPITGVRMALGDYLWKLEKPGYETEERPVWKDSPSVRLEPQGSRPRGMVRVDNPLGGTGIAGLSTRNLGRLRPVYLDRYEVTNQQFKQFVDQGGYQEQAFWEHPFVKDGKPLSWNEAMTEFRDATGRPGPAAWERGSYPDGQDEHPVRGVSWYEAAAYARFAGKALPTVYHWLAASGTGRPLAKFIVPASNFGGAGPAKVGQYQSVGPCGTYDMAGNVKEWCFNSAGDDKRYIMGGGWDEQDYMFSWVDAQSSFHRARNCGFRCVQYLPGQEPAAEVFREAKRSGRDFLKEKLLSDAEFEFVKRLYAYDNQRALNARVIPVEEKVHWVCERVEYDAAYGTERAGAYLYLPRQARPPYQTVVYWPIITVVGTKKWAGGQGVEFLVRSGRAVVMPVYKGTLGRSVGPVSGAAEAWELHKQQAIDLRRAIDYLQTRDDLDAGVIGYYGISWGAMKAPWMLALEDRIKAAVLVDGGLAIGPISDGRWGISEFQGPEQDPVHYLPRIKMPVLMLNGKYDAFFPLVDSQEPMFHLLGTPAEHKVHRLFKTAHFNPNSNNPNERDKETLKWFDRYLGPVTARPSSGAAPE